MRCPSCDSPVAHGARSCPACGAELDQGDRERAEPVSFAGRRYSVRRRIGAGSRKHVYLCRDVVLDRDVAVAVLAGQAVEPGATERLRHEVQLLARLGAHPNVVTVFDMGEERGRPFVVSEYLSCGSLADALAAAEEGRLPIERAVQVATDVCRALEHAHRLGVVHRDVKPGNVWLDGDGIAKLGDFGLAASLDRSQASLRGVVGTADYLPPEQALGRDPDARSDLYGLGAVLYQMLTGRPPFTAADLVSVISQHINAAPVPPSRLRPEVPPALDALVLRLLAKAPDDRPGSAALVLDALAALTVQDATPEADERTPGERLGGGAFVGRERELALLRTAFEEAAAGRTRSVTLVGDAGIGKTRTAEEVATYAQVRGALVLTGRCHEGEGAPPYRPWIQILRAYAGQADAAQLRADLGVGAGYLVALVPELAALVGDVQAPPRLDAQESRFRLFDAYSLFVDALAARGPLVVVLDDLHWADTPSLQLLQFLARELKDARLLLVVTCRDDRASLQHPLSQTLGELARESPGYRIELRGLTEPEVGSLIEVITGVRPASSLVEAVHRRTDGNPFFVGEVIRLLAAEGLLERGGDAATLRVVPPGVREAIARRLAHLSPECHGVLRAAAVLGREFDLDPLARVARLSRAGALQLLQQAEAGRIVAEVGGRHGRFAFSHVLVRETLYEELGVAQRVELHGLAGSALEELHGEDGAAKLDELAYHFFEAAHGGGTPERERALAYATRAGERAMQLAAFDEAGAHFERALELAGDDAQRCTLLVALGRAQMRGGRADEARRNFVRAAECGGDTVLTARAALELAEAFHDTGGQVDQPMIELLGRALDALPEEDDSLRARLLGQYAVALYWVETRDRRDELSRAAVEMAKRIGDPATLAAALSSRHFALWEPENLHERLAIADEIVALTRARRADWTPEGMSREELALQAHRWRLADLLEIGDVEGADREIEAHARLAEESRQPRYLGYTAMFRAMRAFMQGRYDEGEALAQEALKLGQRSQNPHALNFYGAQMLRTWVDRGRLADLEPAMRGILDQAPDVPGVVAGLAFVYCQLNRPDDARACFERVAAKDFADIPRDMMWLASMTMLAEVCAALQDDRRAALLYDLLLPYAGRAIVVGPPAAACYGPGAHYLGLLATTTGRMGEAAAHFEDALVMSQQMGALPLVARTQLAYARVRFGLGDRPRAALLVDEALETASALGMRGLVEQLVSLKLELQGLGAGSSTQSSIEALQASIGEERPDLRPAAAHEGPVTMMFTDIEAFSETTERLGDERVQHLLRRHNAIVRAQVAAHDGHEIKSNGDGFLVTFADVTEAVRCAIAMQQALAEHNQRWPLEQIRVRIGLHVGEVIREDADLYGRAVIVAARVGAQARGGEIVVSADVKERAESDGIFGFDGGRDVELKGLSGVHRIYVCTPAASHA